MRATFRKIVVGGTGYLGPDSTHGTFAAWHLRPDGFTYTSFGYEGRITVTTDDDPENLQVTKAIGVNSKYVVLFGFQRVTNQSNLKTAVVRLDVDGVFRDGFEGAP